MYQIGASSLFSLAARGERICGFCMNSGVGDLVKVGDYLVLASHQACVSAAQKNCCCLDPIHPGDNKACPVHGFKAHWIGSSGDGDEHAH